jgi:putative heme-binding domain-containing protein
MTVPRAIDMDADAQGHLYVASWVNGGFSYSGPNVGYVVRVTPKDGPKLPAFPDLKKIPDDQLVSLIASPSAVTRQYTQREILTRGTKNPAAFQTPLQALASSHESLPVRVAAIFTLTQLLHDTANDAIIALTKNDDIREFALRALADVKNDPTVPVGPFVEALSDSNPRVRLIAAWGLARLNKTEAASQLVPLVADKDPLVSHIAITAMATLKAAAPALKAVDQSTPKLVPGALQVLQQLHQTDVVDQLAEKLKTVNDPALRDQIYQAIARLNYREADWTGDWWGTRPDTSGPYYKTAEWEGTPKVQAVLKNALATEKPEVIKGLVVSLAKNKVDLPGLNATLTRLAASDPSFKAVLVDLAAERKDLTPEQTTLLQEVASSAKEPVAVRAKALRTLQKNAGKSTVLDAALTSAAAIASDPSADKELTGVFNDFTRDGKFAQQIRQLTNLSQGPAGAKKDIATLILLNLSNNHLLQKDRKVAALSRSMESQWSNPKRAVEFYNLIARFQAKSLADRVKDGVKNANPQIASAAQAAEKALGSAGASASAGMALIEKLPFDKVVAIATREKGDAKRGQEFFTKLGCVQCHTVSAEEPPKGPFLGGIAQRYNRSELCESILKPSAKISQGFETQWFKTKDDDDYEGFVTRDAGDEIDIRNILGVVTTLKKSDIKERGKREISVMPEALVAKITPQDLASILAYLESLKGK